MKLALSPDSTSVIAHIFLIDAANTTSGLTGVLYSEIAAYYVRAGGTLTALTPENVPTLGTWANTGANYLGFRELDSVLVPGLYELHLPNNILASGANQVTIQIRVDSSSVLGIPCNLEIQLTPLPANVTQWRGSSVATPTVAGVPEVDITYAGGVVISPTATIAANVTEWDSIPVPPSTSDGYPPVFTVNTVNANVTNWDGVEVAEPAVQGVPSVNISHVNGDAVAPAATIDVNVVQVDGVAVGPLGTIDANVTHWDSVAVPAPTSDGYPVVVSESVSTPVDANIIQINGDATDGNNATLKLKQLHCVNTAGPGIYSESQGVDVGGNSAGMFVKGWTTGAGLDCEGGDAGGGGAGIEALGHVGKAGIWASNDATGPAGLFEGGTGVNGDGIRVVTSGGGGVGIDAADGITGSLSGSVNSVDSRVDANVTHWDGVAVPTPTSDGYPLVQVDSVVGVVDANVMQWNGDNVETPAVAGVPKVDGQYIRGETLEGHNATLQLKKISIGNLTGPAITLNTSAEDTPAVEIESVGGSPGAGIKFAATPAIELNGNITTGNLVGSVSSVTGNVAGSVGSVAAGGITAGSIATGAIDADALAADGIAEIVETLLKYDFTGLAGESQRSLLNAARRLVNKVALAAGTLTVYKEDDATSAFTQTVTTNAAQEPITGVDTD